MDVDHGSRTRCQYLARQLIQLWCLVRPSDFDRMQSRPGVLARLYTGQKAAETILSRLHHKFGGWYGFMSPEELALLTSNSTSLSPQRAMQVAQTMPPSDHPNQHPKQVLVGLDTGDQSPDTKPTWQVAYILPKQNLFLNYVSRAAKSNAVNSGQAVAVIRAMYEADNNEGAADEQAQRALAPAALKAFKSICGHCRGLEAPGGKLRRCAGCGMQCYCNKDCQRKAWKSHKRVCAVMAAMLPIIMEHIKPAALVEPVKPAKWTPRWTRTSMEV